MNNSITAPKGFLAAGISCGLKQSKKRDLAMIVAPAGATAATVFTTNKIIAAPVQICKENLKTRKIEAIIINSGNANCCTGKLGLKNAKTMCIKTSDAIESESKKVLIASTGVIGHQLPIEKIEAGIESLGKKLKANQKAGNDFANAILTTDTKAKQAVTQIKISGKNVTIAGCVKGAGMIAPNMATTLCFITTDVNISKPMLQKALSDAIGNSLNKLTIDGHQSTNDTAIILSSSMAGNAIINKQSTQYKKFAKTLDELCNDLAKQMAMDAEGATRIFTVIVKNASTKKQASQAARAVADYDLVKCAINGADPNWGRIICAIGSSGVNLKLEKLSCKIAGIYVFKNGSPAKFDAKKVSKLISAKEHTIEIDLGIGKATDFCYGCDLSKDYVTINADYHT